MKYVCMLFALVVLCASAGAEESTIVVNTGNNINCVTTKGEQGFEAHTWTIGGTVATSIQQISGVVTGKPSLKDLVITKTFDACSAQLIHSFLLGASFPMKKLTLIQYGLLRDEPIALQTVVLTDPIINTYTVSGAVGSNPVETLAFAYKSLCVTSVSKNKEGGTTNPVTVCYDITTNKVY